MRRRPTPSPRALLVVAPGVDLFLLIGSSNGGGGGGSEPSATDGTAHHASGGGIFLEPSPSSSSISEACVVVRAQQSYAEGDEVRLDCGVGLSNGRRLLSGGAIEPSNPADAVELAFTLPLHPAAVALYANLYEELDGAVPSSVEHNPLAHPEMDLLPAEFVESAAAGEGGESGEGGEGQPSATDLVLHVRLGGGAKCADQLRRVVRFFQAEILGRARSITGRAWIAHPRESYHPRQRGDGSHQAARDTEDPARGVRRRFERHSARSSAQPSVAEDEAALAAMDAAAASLIEPRRRRQPCTSLSARSAF